MGRRIARVVRVLEAHARESSLQRLPHLGDDEIGEIGRAVNDLLANLTSLEVRMIEQGHELRHTREELVLKKALGLKSAELEQRLRERALLFDIVRASASEQELDAVLGDIAARLGKALLLRECMLFLVDAETRRLTLRAAYGFERPGELLERIVLFDEDALGKVAQLGEPIMVHDLAALEGETLWEPIPQSGSIAILPIVHHGKTTGVMAATREQTDAFSDVETGLLEAISDQLGLAIRHTQLFDELRRGSQHDDLTGLGNRRLLRIRLEDELHRAERFGQAVSILAIDIDYFKALNDRHGHPTGDASLRKLAGLMTRNLRRIDTIARTGGEEFVVLLPRTNLSEAAKVADKLRSMVERTEFPGRRRSARRHVDHQCWRGLSSPRRDWRRLARARGHGALRGQRSRPELRGQRISVGGLGALPDEVANLTKLEGLLEANQRCLLEELAGLRRERAACHEDEP